jgi:hypothetical protein
MKAKTNIGFMRNGSLINGNTWFTINKNEVEYFKSRGFEIDDEKAEKLDEIKAAEDFDENFENDSIKSIKIKKKAD